MSDIETIRWAHEPESVYFDGGDFSHRECRMCRQRWTADRPCDTRVVLDALDRALVAAEGLAEADMRHRHGVSYPRHDEQERTSPDTPDGWDDPHRLCGDVCIADRIVVGRVPPFEDAT